MADIEKIVDNINLPKQILDKTEALLKTLFGPSFDEIGGMISDNVRLRRFKNQIKIFTKAQNILKQNKLDPQKVSLKVLAPLIEYSSYEEDETLQDKWAKLTTNILTDHEATVFHQNCIAILNRLSANDAHLLDKLFQILTEEKKKQNASDIKDFEIRRKKAPSVAITPPPTIDEYPITLFKFNIHDLSKKLNLKKDRLELNISNLVSLGLLKYETDIDIDADNYNDAYYKTYFNVTMYNNENFIFTHMGHRFVIVCK